MAKPKRSGLGKGLDSLIPEIIDSKEEYTEEDGVASIKITRIEPNRSQPRKEFDRESLEELAESVKQYGILQPLLVQKRDDYYEIIAGERRWRAAKLAGIKEVPVIIRDYSEQEIVEISLIENIQREDLNPIEEALAYKRLIDEYYLKQEEIALRVSKSRTAITNTMRLLKLSDMVKQMLVNDEITSGHARALLALSEVDLQDKIALEIAENDLSVRETEALIKKIQKPSAQKIDTGKENEFIYEDIEKKIENIVGTKVNLNRKKTGKGRIEIEFYSEDELDRIFDLLMSIKA